MSELGAQAIRTIHEADIQPVLRSLTDDEWMAASACEGWRVLDVVSHMTSNMKMFVSPEPLPEPEPGAGPMGAEEMAEALLGARRQWTPAQVMAEYDELVEGFLGAMAGLQDPSVADSEMNLGDLGSHPTHILSDVFTFDHYCHLRIDTLAPGGPIERTVPEADHLRLKPTVDWMMAGIPPMCADAMAPVLDRPIAFTFTGPGESTWLLSPNGEGELASVAEVDAEPGDAAATVTSSAHDFVSWGTQRSAWSDACELRGDTEFAGRVLNTVNVI